MPFGSCCLLRAARAHGVRVAWAEEGGGVGTSDSGSCVDGEHEHVRAVELAGQGQAAEDQPDELPPQRRVWVWVWRVGLHTMGGGRARDGVVEAALRTLLDSRGDVALDPILSRRRCPSLHAGMVGVLTKEQGDDDSRRLWS